MVSTGCRRCYARRIAARSAKPGQVYYGAARITKDNQPRWTGKLIRADNQHMREPLTWFQGRRIMVDSMSDLFHERIPDAWRDEAFGVMALCGQHAFFILTKRPDVALAYFRQADVWQRIEDQARRIYAEHYHGEYPSGGHLEGPLPNVWLGVSVENQHAFERRCNLLLQIPAAHRFLAVEPLLAKVNLWDAWLKALDWILVSGEGGPDARLCKVAWIEGVVKQCQAAGKPVYVKQLGTAIDLPVRCEHGLEECTACQQRGLTHPVDRHANVESWPEALRVRELPESRVERTAGE